jgi:hypothetical protein
VVGFQDGVEPQHGKRFAASGPEVHRVGLVLPQDAGVGRDGAGRGVDAAGALDATAGLLAGRGVGAVGFTIVGFAAAGFATTAGFAGVIGFETMAGFPAPVGFVAGVGLLTSSGADGLPTTWGFGASWGFAAAGRLGGSGSCRSRCGGCRRRRWARWRLLQVYSALIQPTSFLKVQAELVGRQPSLTVARVC